MKTNEVIHKVKQFLKNKEAEPFHDKLEFSCKVIASEIGGVATQIGGGVAERVVADLKETGMNIRYKKDGNPKIFVIEKRQQP